MFQNVTEIIPMEKHTSELTAITLDDYPYGRLRTQIRYWIEPTKRGSGFKFASQTKDPKRGCWNKPKYSNVQDVIVLVRKPVDTKNGEVSGVSYECISYTWSNDKAILEFLQAIGVDPESGKMDQNILPKQVLKDTVFYYFAKKEYNKPEDIDNRMTCSNVSNAHDFAIKRIKELFPKE